MDRSDEEIDRAPSEGAQESRTSSSPCAHSDCLPDSPVSPSTSADARTGSPFEKLPEELFEAIIRTAVNRNSTSYQSTDLQSYRLVCSRWRQVIDYLPRFWYTVRSEQCPSWIRGSLDKARDVPLTIRWAIPALDQRPVTRAYAEALDAMDSLFLPEVGRWNKLSVRFHGSNVAVEVVRQMHSFAASKMKCLSLTGRILDTLQWDSMGGCASQIESVYLKRYAIPWASQILLTGKLKALTLLRMRRGAPRVDEIERILLANPDLSGVELEGVMVSYPNWSAMMSADVWASSGANATKIPLPKLNRFTMKANIRAVTRLLQQLEMPVCTRMKLHVDSPVLDDGGWIPLLLRLLSQRVAELAYKCSRLTVVASDHSVGFTTDTRWLTLLVQSMVTEFNQPLAMMLAAIWDSMNPPPPSSTTPAADDTEDEKPPPPNITIDWRPRNWRSDVDGIVQLDQLSLLARTATSLLLSCETTTLRRTLVFLSEPTPVSTPSPSSPPSASETRWPYPNLRRLEIQVNYAHSPVEVCAFFRARCVEAPLEGVVRVEELVLVLPPGVMDVDPHPDLVQLNEEHPGILRFQHEHEALEL